jgi:peptidoglycan/LPS O-acetylase OafA/YrhL
MLQIPTSSGQARLVALDSLRGIAAFAVLLGHTVSVCEWNTDFTRLPLLNHLFDGRSAVTLFFVLSGFVLTFTYLNRPDKPFMLIPFYIRRFTRIWLPWFAFFLLSLLAREIGRFSWPASRFQEGPWLLSMWSAETNLPNLLKQMVFQEHDSKRMLLSQDWSLGVELRVSLLIPVFLLLARLNWLSLAVTGIGFAYFAHISGYYCTSFVVGVLAARWNATTKDFQWGGALFVLGLILYQARWLRDIWDVFPPYVREREIWLLTTLGCVLILLGSLRSGRIGKALEHPFLLYLGRISYSLYLMQMIILICVAPWIVAGLGEIGVRSVGLTQFLLLVSITCISLPLADLSERFIEVPCIRLGKSLTAWLERLALVRRLRV